MNTLAAHFSAPRAAEGLQAMLAQHGPVRTVAWARAAADAETCVAALAVLEQVQPSGRRRARAGLSGNPKKVERVNRRLDSFLARLAGASKDLERDAALLRAVEEC